ncbi:hypothetical protein H072_1870 [Dactylellina haptotyla CBS 200.50]|uniref:Nephrocystin 3-like N-terminal domain-containing protein n=1 Tax=Dactylellina haptotyla (strain CBS 200.50) TaxID=1284197 RepID=S8C8Y6_DACHA|nr:hypothetical protein H072_1870 [Dactylellina haptotyla CBS 200.50]
MCLDLYQAETKFACLQSLSFEEIDDRLNDIRESHPNTCNWIFETIQFEQWKNRENIANSNGILWIKGKPGAGKSTLVKFIFLRAKELFPDYIIGSYFFNARGLPLQKSFLGMLRSIVYQFLDQDQQQFDRFIPMFLDKNKKHGTSKNWAWHPGELQRFLLEMLRFKLKPTILFIDALDECHDDEVKETISFLEKLSAAAVASNVVLNICQSSRHYPRYSIRKVTELVLDNRTEHNQAIEKYIEGNLKIEEDSIKTELLEKADGVFMWVILATRMLNDAYNDGRLKATRRKLDQIPSDLDEVFRTILGRDNPHQEQTVLMMQWILFSESTLHQEQIYEAVLAGTDPEALSNQDAIVPEDIEKYIISTGRGLIECVRRKGGTHVRFIHKTATDFLLRNNRLKMLDPSLTSDVIGSSHSRLAACCLAYLETEGFDNSHPESQQVSRDRHPFLSYVNKNLFYHAERAQARGVHQHEFLQKLQAEHLLFQRLKRLHDTDYNSSEYAKYGTDTSLLYVLSLNHCAELTRVLLNDKNFDVDVNARAGYFSNALQAAAAASSFLRDKNENTIRILLDAGADINAKGGRSGTALQAAVTSIHRYAGNFEVRVTSAVVEMLLKAGAEINTECGYYGNPLQAAAAAFGYGQNLPSNRIIRMLLDAGADINAFGGHYGTALQAAAATEGDMFFSGYDEYFPVDTIQLLLDSGAEVNARGGYFGNALQAAAFSAAYTSRNGCSFLSSRYNTSNDLKAVVEKLLENGADINAQGGYYGNALQAAASNAIYYPRIVLQALLDAGANVNAQGGHYNTATQAALAACHSSHSEHQQGFIVQVLDMFLKAGAMDAAESKRTFYQKYEWDIADIELYEQSGWLALVQAREDRRKPPPELSW